MADTGGELQWLRLCSLLAHRLRVQLQGEAHLSVYLTASAAMIDEPARSKLVLSSLFEERGKRNEDRKEMTREGKDRSRTGGRGDRGRRKERERKERR